MLLNKRGDVLILQEGVKAELAKELSKIRVGESLEINDLPRSTKEEKVEQILSSSLVNVGDSHPKVESSEDPDECVDTSKEGWIYCTTYCFMSIRKSVCQR